MNSKDLFKEWIKDHEFRKEYYKFDIPLEVSNMIVYHRVKKNLTQEELAKLTGTKQSGIARAERGASYLDLRFLEKIAGAFGMEVIIKFRKKYKEGENNPVSHHSPRVSTFQRKRVRKDSEKVSIS